MERARARQQHGVKKRADVEATHGSPWVWGRRWKGRIPERRFCTKCQHRSVLVLLARPLGVDAHVGHTAIFVSIAALHDEDGIQQEPDSKREFASDSRKAQRLSPTYSPLPPSRPAQGSPDETHTIAQCFDGALFFDAIPKHDGRDPFLCIRNPEAPQHRRGTRATAPGWSSGADESNPGHEHCLRPVAARHPRL